MLIEARFAELDGRLGVQDFFCGALSVADIGLFMTVLFTQRLGGPPLDAHPSLGAWYRRLLDRPAFAKAAGEIAAADRELSPALAAR
jgi:glutathione S-transferase